MTTADRHIGQLDIEAIQGQALTVRFAFDEAPGGAWSAVFAGQMVALVADGDDLVLTLTGEQATAALRHGSYRIRQDGADRIGGQFRTAHPQTTPGEQTVTVVVADATPVAVTVLAGSVLAAIDGGTP